jgi:hypothetical protein
MNSELSVKNFSVKDLVGVWRRRSIEVPNQPKDTTTQVYWLQTHACFGDIRIPIDRPAGMDCRSLADLSEPEVIALSHQQGFGGITQVEGATCQWHRHLDYQPPSEARDIGLLRWEQNILIESGVESVYLEEWERIDDGRAGCIALVLEADKSLGEFSRWQGCLIVVGDYFLQIIDSRTVLPKADSLISLLEPAADSAQQQHYLNCEISFGRRRTGQVPWEIKLSTLPWREGRSLWSEADLELNLDQKSLTQIMHGDVASVRHWQVREWSSLDFLKHSIK